jgi:PAS domain S-box-containing protein
VISPQTLLANHEALINSTEDLIWSVDTDLRVITANRAYREVIRQLGAKVPGPGEPALMPEFGEELNAKWTGYYQRALAGEKFSVTEEILHPGSNSIESALISFNPLYDDAKQVIGTACYSKGITDETRNRQAQQAAKEELAKILDSSMDMICTINEAGYFCKVSAASHKMLGYAPDELVGKTYHDFVYSADLEKTKTVDREIKGGKEVTNFENRYIRKDGITIPMIWSARWDNSEKMMYCVARDASDTKKTEQEINLLINNTEECFVLLDKELRIVSFNRQFHTLYEKYLSKSVQQGAFILDYTQPGRREIAHSIYRRVLLGSVETAEITVPVQGEAPKIFSIIYKPALDAQSDIIGAFVTIRDTTEEAIVKHALQLSNERYSLATKATSDAIWDWDISTETLYWGEGFHSMFGYDLHVLNSGISSWTDHIHPEDIDRIISGIHKLIAGSGTNWTDEYRYQKKDTTFAYVIDKGFVIRDQNGKAIRMVGAMRDITLRKQEELRLKLLESVITNTTDSIMITEAEPFRSAIPKVIYVNEAFSVMTGYQSGEVIGKKPDFPYGPRTDRNELRRLYEALETQRSCKVELLCYRKNRESFWMNMTVTPVNDNQGRCTHWIAVQRDVTSRKLAEESLQEKNKEEERKHIAREVHDELGQLASALKIDIDWLTLKTEPTEMAVQRLSHANKTVQILISSIRKIASRLRPSVLDDLGLHAALKWHCKEFENLNGISCSFDPGFDDSVIPAEWKTELFRMVQESLTNVMRHAKATCVNVLTKEDIHNLFITVKDNGHGFHRDEKKHTLGLIGLRERVQSLNGELTIDSEVGKGTTICIVIPKILTTSNA